MCESAGIAQNFQLVGLQFAGEAPGSGGSAARNHKGFELPKRRNIHHFELHEAGDVRQFSFAQHRHAAKIFVGQAFDVKRHGVMPGRLRRLRQAAVEHVNVLGLVEQSHGVSRQIVAHARSHATIGNYSHTRLLSLAVEVVLQAHGFGVSAQIAKGYAVGDGDFGERQVVEVRNRAEHHIMAFDGASDGILIADIEGNRICNRASDQLIYAICRRFGVRSVGVGQDEARGFAETRKVIGCCNSLPASSENDVGKGHYKPYSPAPSITIGMVGVVDPASGSTVMANALASAPAGSGGLTTVALPRASGWKTPAGIGAPCLGISHSS